MGFAIFSIGVVLLLIGLGVLLYAANGRRVDRFTGTVTGLGLVVVAALTIFFDSFTIVEARSVAVQTSFGKVQGPHLASGWHWVAPWNDIEKFDASVQTLKFYKDEKEDDGHCITVRLGNNTTACVDVTAQWNIDHTGNVNELYLQYRTFDNIHNNLVKRQLQSALNTVFGSYDPLAAVDVTRDVPTVNTKDLQERARIELQSDIGKAIKISSVTIPIVHFDGDTEARLKAFQSAKADTRIAEQNTETAKQQALANKLLAEQAAIKDPGVQYQNCLNLMAALAKNGQLQHLPPTFTCNQGASSGGIILQPK